MSSFVVGADHIDYLVSAVLAYAPHRLAGRTPTELGRQLLAENVDTVVDRYLDDENEYLSEEYRAELREERAQYHAKVQQYAFREVLEIEPAQAARVAMCWQYQRTREGYDDVPETWVTADEVIANALTAVDPTRLLDPAGPRSRENLDSTGLAWAWERSSAKPATSS